MWEGFLCQTISKALDYGVDSVTVLDNVASTISQNQSPTFSSSPRVADLLMSHLDMVDARDIPGAVIEFVNETLRSSYPPEPRNTTTCMWAARTLTRVLDSCPPELFLGLLENLQEGLCLWISDEYQAWNEREFTHDVRGAAFPGDLRIAYTCILVDHAVISDHLVECSSTSS